MSAGDIDAVFCGGLVAVAVAADRLLTHPGTAVVPVDASHILKFAAGCDGPTISRPQFDTFLRIFGPRESALLCAWRTVFDPSTGALHPWFWASVDAAAFKAEVVARYRKEDGPFAVRFSRQSIGFAVAHFGPAGTVQESLILATVPDRSQFYFDGQAPEASPAAVLRKFASIGLRLPVGSKLSERSADAAAVAPRWHLPGACLRSTAAREVLARLAEGVPGLGAGLQRGAAGGGAVGQRRAVCAELLDAGRAQRSFVAAAAHFAGAACVASVLGEPFSCAVGLTDAAVSLVREFRRRSGSSSGSGTPLGTSAAAAAEDVAAGAAAVALYPVPGTLLADAALLAAEAQTVGSQLVDRSEALFVRCAALDAAYAARVHPGHCDPDAALKVAQFHLQLLEGAPRGAVPPDQLTLVRRRCSEQQAAKEAAASGGGGGGGSGGGGSPA